MSQPSPLRKVFLPLVPAYRFALRWRERRLGSGAEPVERLRFPVVSIGNLSTGGTGKTPLTIALAKALTRRGMQVDVLSRGYGRRDELPVRVALQGSAQEFGDEPLVIACEAGVPVYVAPRRYDAGVLAEGDSLAIAVLGEEPRPVIHLLDDGFQHRQLHRDIDILLVSRDDLADRLLPAGNLREPLSSLQRATVLAIPANEREVEQYLSEIIPIDNSEATRWIGPIWRLNRTMDVPVVDGRVAAFCGIARPEQFFAGLEAAGLHLAARNAFPDHHRYTAGDLARLQKSARAAGAVALMTTEKDLARVGQWASTSPDALPLMTAGLRVEIEDEDEAITWLLERLRPTPANLSL